MKNDLLMPANYAFIAEDELSYLDGGELSERQVKFLLGSASAVITAIMLVPDVFTFMLSPILKPVTDQINKVTTGITDKITGLFK